MDRRWRVREGVAIGRAVLGGSEVCWDGREGDAARAVAESRVTRYRMQFILNVFAVEMLLSRKRIGNDKTKKILLYYVIRTARQFFSLLASQGHNGSIPVGKTCEFIRDILAL